MFISKEIHFYGLRRSFKNAARSSIFTAFCGTVLMLVIIGLCTWGLHYLDVASSSTNATGYLVLAYDILVISTAFLAFILIGVGMPILFAIRKNWIAGVKIALLQLLMLVLFTIVVGRFIVSNSSYKDSFYNPTDNSVCGPEGLCKGAR